ncbi:helix-turn-helix domain-containing protein [Cohnella faecalis]|uniref:Helix-turn-helix domain-containing protein n=1 Tax=Cohnella faecalis TaxID=2315694 RepID=A0A398CDA6_9BACL|nr:AraC family transcriptional regulator [Cohnella faecalis]RIE01166.1 helix-turn-helix domain-containing protein [Cohnella faecalis]
MRTRTVENDFLKGTMFEIVEARCDNQPPDWMKRLKSIKHHALIFLDAGTGTLIVNGHPSKLIRDSFYMYAPGTRLELQLQPGSGLKLYAVMFDLFRTVAGSDYQRSYVRDLTFPFQGQHRMSGGRFKRLCRLLTSEGEALLERRRFLGQQYLYDILDDLLNAASIAADEDDVETRLNRSISYILRNYREDIRVDKLAGLARLHPTYYTHVFKQSMRKPPVSFLTDLRMSKAKELLLLTNKPIRDIARDVGYEDEFYFSRRFKKTSGIAPNSFAKKDDMRVVSLSFPYTDHLHTLGIVPSAAQLHPFLPIQTVALKLPEHAIDPWEIDRQVFIDAQPDLILCKDNVLPRARENINDIAPIISIPWSGEDVYSHLSNIAELVNKQPEAKQWLELHERKSERLRARVRHAIGQSTVTICVARGEKLRIYGARNIGHVFYRSLRLAPPDAVAKRMKPYPAGTIHNWIAIQEDELIHYESDFLFFVVGNEEDLKRVHRLIRTSSSWMMHPAVRANKIGFLNWDKWMIYAPSMLDVQLEAAAQLLTGSAPY